MHNDFHNKLLADVEAVRKTLKAGLQQANKAIEELEDEQLKTFFAAKLSQAMAGKLDIDTFLKQVQDAQTASNNKQ